MSSIPRQQRNNLITYANYVVGNSTTEKLSYQQGLVKYLEQNASAVYNRQNLEDLSRINSSLAIAIKKSRYDDLFDDFVQSGYIDTDSLDSEDGLRQALTKSLEKNPNLKSYKDSTPRRFRNLVGDFLRGMLDTKQGTRIIQQERRAVLVTPDNFEEYQRRVNERQQEKFRDLVRRSNAIAVYNKRLKREQLIYRDRKRRYRDINTGRYAPRSSQLTFR